MSKNITPRQRQFMTDKVQHVFRIPDLNGTTLSGLMRVWAIALANGWLSLAELCWQQIEKLLDD
jgi:hypothetical protein